MASDKAVRTMAQSRWRPKPFIPKLLRSDEASKHLLAAELTLFMLLEFTLGPIWVWIFVNEVPTSWTLIGGSVVIIAVLFKSGLEILKGNP